MHFLSHWSHPNEVYHVHLQLQDMEWIDFFEPLLSPQNTLANRTLVLLLDVTIYVVKNEREREKWNENFILKFCFDLYRKFITESEISFWCNWRWKVKVERLTFYNVITCFTLTISSLRIINEQTVHDIQFCNVKSRKNRHPF